MHDKPVQSVSWVHGCRHVGVIVPGVVPGTTMQAPFDGQLVERLHGHVQMPSGARSVRATQNAGSVHGARVPSQACSDVKRGSVTR